MKYFIKNIPLYPYLRKLFRKTSNLGEAHRKLHNVNNLFYTLSPMLLVAIHKAFYIQQELKISGEGG